MAHLLPGGTAKKRHAITGFAALAALLVGCSDLTRVILSARVADTADYTITQVSIIQPPPQPGAGTLTVGIAYELHQTGGNVSPIVWLFDDDGFLRFDEDVLAKVNFVEGANNLSPGQHNGTTTFTLRCDGDEVVGPNGGSGEGHKDFLFGTINEAEIKAAAQRPGDPNNPIVVSGAVELWCEE